MFLKPIPSNKHGTAKRWKTLRRNRLNWLFLATVAIPTAFSVLYFGLIASDVYISEARFVVRTPDKPRGNALGMLLSGAGFSTGGQETHAVQEYVRSRDALERLDAKSTFKAAYSQPHIDFINRFNSFGYANTFEDLYDYYQRYVRAKHDTTTSVTTLEVRAFDPKTAHDVNARLIGQAEALVNRLNTRGRADLIRYGEQEVTEAEQRARRAAAALGAYRNRQRVLDPERQAQVQVQLVSKLQDELIATRGQLSQLRAFTPDNPQVAVLEQRASALQADIARETNRVAGGGSGSLAAKATQIEQLQFENEFAQRALASALSSYEEARNEARRQQVYLERIVEPNVPDEPNEPRRLRGVFATFLLGLVAWGILTMLLAGLREHQD